MLKNIYSYEFFFEIKEHNSYILDNELQKSLNNINKIIDNNYGI